MQAAHRFVLAFGLAALSASSFAATTVYTSPASFLANVAPGSYLENFDSVPSSPPAGFSGSGFSYTVSAPGGTYGSGEFIGTNFPSEALTITFTSGNVSALGGNFYAANLSDMFQSVAMTLTLSDGTTVTFTPASAADSYRGFASTTTISSLTITAAGFGSYAGLDNFTVGVTAVPEPASAVLMLLGAAGLMIARRRQA